MLGELLAELFSRVGRSAVGSHRLPRVGRLAQCVKRTVQVEFVAHQGLGREKLERL